MQVLIILSALSGWLLTGHVSLCLSVSSHTCRYLWPPFCNKRLHSSHMHTNKHGYCILTTRNLSTHMLMVDRRWCQQNHGVWEWDVWRYIIPYCPPSTALPSTTAALNRGRLREGEYKWAIFLQRPEMAVFEMLQYAKDFSVCLCVQISIPSDMRVSWVETSSDLRSLPHTTRCQAVSSTVSTARVNKSGSIWVKINTYAWILSVCVFVASQCQQCVLLQLKCSWNVQRCGYTMDWVYDLTCKPNFHIYKRTPSVMCCQCNIPITSNHWELWVCVVYMSGPMCVYVSFAGL